MSQLQLHAITLENVIKLQLITITFLSAPTLIMQQSANLVVNSLTVYSYGFSLMTVGQASDSIMVLT